MILIFLNLFNLVVNRVIKFHFLFSLILQLKYNCLIKIIHHLHINKHKKQYFVVDAMNYLHKLENSHVNIASAHNAAMNYIDFVPYVINY